MNWLWFFKSDAKADESVRKSLSQDLSQSRYILWVSFFCIFAFLFWAYWADLDQITRATGSVVSSSRSQIVQSQEGGVIQEMKVRDGDIVDRDDVLVVLDSTRVEAAFLETRARAASLATTVARLQAEALGKEPEFPAQTNDYPEFRTLQLELMKKRRTVIEEDVLAMQEMMALVKKELDMTRPLLKSGDVSATEILRLERQMSDAKAQITNKRNKYFQDTQAELSKAREEYESVQQLLAQRKNQLDQTKLRAPLHGVVKNVRITTRGGVIRPSEEVMQIVPLEDDLIIEAKVSPTDIGFIKPGLTATVKIDAYDYTIYGDLPGTLTYISADTLTEDLRQGEQPYYRVRVRTMGRKFSGAPEKDLEIQPGMTATVEIKTGTNTVLNYLVKPIVKTLQLALKER
jgi:adhesin transport system membrane fusion protein